MANKRTKHDNLISLTDSRGVDRQFEPLEIFSVGKKNFALLRPVKGPKNEATLLKFSVDREGLPRVFFEPTAKEFEAAARTLGARSDCACGCCCDAECSPAAAGKPAARKKAPAKKAQAKKSRRTSKRR